MQTITLPDLQTSLPKLAQSVLDGEWLVIPFAGKKMVLHLAHDDAEHYLAQPLAELAAAHSNLQVQLINTAELPAALAELRLVSRQTMALLCGSPASVEAFTRRLYLLGLPRNQMLADVFLPRSV